jgi:hypothetical protein
MTFYENRTPMFDTGNNPCSIPDDDPLLAKLMEVHGDRRYAVLNLETKKGKEK